MNSGDRGPAAISATSTAETVEGAACILADGGSATDAVLSTALAQIACCAGSWVSLAGILSFIHFDASTGAVTSLNGGFDTIREETNPLSIPSFGKPSGRSVLVPGFPAALFAAHSRYGRMSVARVFAHAIGIAEEGFVIDERFSRILQRRRKALTRLPEGRGLFFDRDGCLPQPGQRLRQPAFAATLRAAVSTGPEHFYDGDWARQLVAAVRRERGRMTREDLAQYRPEWCDPVKAKIGKATVFAPGLPALGGVYLVEALHLAEAAAATPGAGVFTPDHDTAERLFWLMQITRARYFASFLDASERLDPAVALALWREIHQRRVFQFIDGLALMECFGHSDSVVAIDRWGNAAALCHSINTLFWGHTGLFVGGVSIPDAASHQQRAVLQAGPGGRLPDYMNPAISLQGSEHVLACSAAGASLHEVTVETLVEVFMRRKALDALSRAPPFLSPAWTRLFRLASVNERVLGALADLLFSAGVRVLLPFPRLARWALDVPARVVRGAIAPGSISRIREMGQRIAVLERDPLPTFWVGLTLDRTTKKHSGRIRSSACDGIKVGVTLIEGGNLRRSYTTSLPKETPGSAGDPSKADSINAGDHSVVTEVHCRPTHHRHVTHRRNVARWIRREERRRSRR